jgi:ADP-ribose pyrophosphatase
MSGHKTLEALEVLDERRVEDGWLKVARRRLRNRYADGTTSAEYPADSAWRVGIDAVAVVAWRRRDGAVEVLLREYLRPGIDLRGRLDPPVADAWRPLPLLWEVCAGIPEPDERHPDRFAACGARELAEEMGLHVSADRLRSLGHGIYPSAGILTEVIHLFAAEVDAEPSAAAGDGTPFEEAGRMRWWRLEEAFAACRTGEIADAKTEVALRRLAEDLSPRSPS